MDIFEATTVADLTTSLTSVIAANIAVIIGLVGLGLGVRFVMGWFKKSTNKIKA